MPAQWTKAHIEALRSQPEPSESKSDSGLPKMPLRPVEPKPHAGPPEWDGKPIPWYEPERVAEVPDGWSNEGWVGYLEHKASVCIHENKAAGFVATANRIKRRIKKVTHADK